MAQEWEIEALDTLFFRGPDPFGAGETVALRSLFPPTPRTVQGFVRTALLEAHCVDIGLFAAGGCSTCAAQATCPVQEAVGSPSALGSLNLSGPYPVADLEYKPGQPTTVKTGRRRARLFVAPADLRRDERGRIFRLWPGAPVSCDLGSVRLPDDPAGARDLGSPMEWLTEDGLAAYLRGLLPPVRELIGEPELLDREPRTGIAREPETRAPKEHMLYQIEPLRARPGVRLAVTVDGVAEDVMREAAGLHRFGGEGRLAALGGEHTAGALPPDPEVERSIDATQRLLLLLLQAADFDGSWLPSGFEEAEQDEATIWRGELNGVKLRIVSICGRSPVAIGGWSLATGEAAELRQCVAAGGVYYCELEESLTGAEVMGKLHHARVGNDTAIGFGEIVVGAWPEQGRGGG